MATGLQLNLNRVIGNTIASGSWLDAQGAANKWAVVSTIAPVHAATDAKSNGTYNNGTNGVGATITGPAPGSALVVDNHTMLLGERVLFWLNDGTGLGGATSKSNGIYTVTNAGAVGTPWVITRSTDANSGWELHKGAYVTVTAAPSYVGSHWGHTFELTNTGTGPDGGIVFGTDNITFADITLSNPKPTSINLDLLGALNYKAATTGLGLNKVCNLLAGTTNLDANAASEYFS